MRGLAPFTPISFVSPVRADLHIHSMYSDGVFAPEQLCHRAQITGLSHIALCDHDTVVGIAPMRAAVQAMRVPDEGGGHMPKSTEEQRLSPAISLTFLPGVELSSGPDGRTHVLGYGVREDHTVLRAALEEMSSRRRQRFAEMLEKLRRLGIEIPPEALPAAGHAVPGRAHVARALVQTGACNTLKQAFECYVGEGKPAYVPYRHLTAGEAVALLKVAKAVPVLAHPCRLSLEEPARRALILSLREQGLMGVEVFHPSASRRDIRALEPFVRAEGLLVTGGSDFHGDTGARADMGRLPPGWARMAQDVQALMERFS